MGDSPSPSRSLRIRLASPDSRDSEAALSSAEPSEGGEDVFCISSFSAIKDSVLSVETELRFDGDLVASRFLEGELLAMDIVSFFSDFFIKAAFEDEIPVLSGPKFAGG